MNPTTILTARLRMVQSVGHRRQLAYYMETRTLRLGYAEFTLGRTLSNQLTRTPRMLPEEQI
jgi:hypothetical protein